MPDRESVITHLQIIHTWAEFARERDLQFFTPKHLEDIAQWSDDALALMKEQEAVEPYIDGDEAKCPICKWVRLTRQELVGDSLLEDHFFNFCPHCGRRVKWG